MAKFSGKIGYAETVESGPGVYKEVITERNHRGDIIRNYRKLDGEEKVNHDINVNNAISIVADAYAVQHFFAMRYVVWEGVRWTINTVEVSRPRLILFIGGVYNGPTPAAATTP